MNLKRVVKATIFIITQAAIGIFVASVISATWVVTCGILAAAFATFVLIVFAGDEKSAQLFFAENWQELEEEGMPVMGLAISLISLIWLVPILCFFLSLMLVILRRSGWF